MGRQLTCMWSTVVSNVCKVLQPTTSKKFKIYTKPLSSSESDCDGVLISDIPAINVTNWPGRNTASNTQEVDVHTSGKAERFEWRRDGC